MENKKSLSSLTAISAIDGRYHNLVSELSEIMSEYGLIRRRILVETKYLVALSKTGIVREFTGPELKILQEIADDDIKDVKEIEKETRHDVKAVEKMLRRKLEKTSLSDIIEKIHFGLTSEDINNISYRLQLKYATEKILIPVIVRLIQELVNRAENYKEVPMLARTHGQAAVPTTVGKEFAVFANRLNKELIKLKNSNLTGKLNGAVGNYNALYYAYPDIDWINFSEEFIKSLDLAPNNTTTQINTPEDIVDMIQTYQRINGVIIDLDQDMWRYISDHYFILANKKGEVGSSTMPQKVNPIDFENSEGRLGIANSMGDFFVRKLPISRMQRDLSDSTVIRDLGTFLANSLIGYKSNLTGLSRTALNKSEIEKSLKSDWSILAEGVQTLLRKENHPDPYSLIASLTKGENVNPEDWNAWVDSLSVSSEAKDSFKKLTPKNYIGLSVELTEKAISDIKSSHENK